MSDIELPPDPVFLVWGPPRYGPRSKVFARTLGMDIEFLYSLDRRGGWYGPIKYGYQGIKTVLMMLKRRPGVVFVQSPPSLAPLIVWVLGRFTGTQLVVDAHSAAMLSEWWLRPRWLYRAMARGAVATIVTNEHFAAEIESWGGQAMVIRDIPTTYPEGGHYPHAAGTNIAVVCTFNSDEPIAETVEAARDLPEATFHITGKPDRAAPGLVESAPANVIFTDFLPDEDYFELLRGSDAVMCLTTRDNTMQRGACEALSLGRPIITSDWPLLRMYFNDGTIHIDNTVEGIRAAVRELEANPAALAEGISRLQESQRLEWEKRLEELSAMLGSSNELPTSANAD